METLSNHCFPWQLKCTLHGAATLCREPATRWFHLMPFSACNGRERLFIMSLCFSHSIHDFIYLHHISPSVILNSFIGGGHWLLTDLSTLILPQERLPCISSLDNLGGSKSQIYQMLRNYFSDTRISTEGYRQLAGTLTNHTSASAVPSLTLTPLGF